MTRFLFLILITISTGLNGRTVPPVDFTMTAIDGTVYNLYNEINNGKPVILVFFNTGCGSCQEAVPTLEGIWKRDALEGQKGWVWGFETGNASVQTIQQFMETYGASFVIFRTAQNPSILYPETGYNITYTPQYVLVCNANEYKKLSFNELAEAFKSCSQAVNIPALRRDLAVTVLSSSVVVEFPENRVGEEVLLIDVLGRIVSSVKNQTLSDTVTVSRPKLSGVYIVSIRFRNGEIISRKVMIAD